MTISRSSATAPWRSSSGSRRPRSPVCGILGVVKIHAGVLLAVLVLVGCASDSGSEESLTTQGSSSTTGFTTTSTPATTTTTRMTTTSLRTATTAGLGAESAANLFLTRFEVVRESLIELWSQSPYVDSVDELTAEADTEGDALTIVVTLDVTSGRATPESQHDGAWEIMRTMAVLWDPLNGAWFNETWSPPFRLVNSGRPYECSAEFMVDLADARASRLDWEAQCA